MGTQVVAKNWKSLTKKTWEVKVNHLSLLQKNQHQSGKKILSYKHERIWETEKLKELPFLLLKELPLKEPLKKLFFYTPGNIKSAIQIITQTKINYSAKLILQRKTDLLFWAWIFSFHELVSMTLQITWQSWENTADSYCCSSNYFCSLLDVEAPCYTFCTSVCIYNLHKMPQSSRCEVFEQPHKGIFIQLTIWFSTVRSPVELRNIIY